MLKHIIALSLCSQIFLFNSSMLIAAKVSQSLVNGEGRYGGIVSYPNHLKIEIKLKKKLPLQNIDTTVGWYRILNQRNNKYRKASALIHSGFTEIGNLQKDSFLDLFKKGRRYSYVLKDDILRIAEILEDIHPATRFSKHFILADFATSVSYAGELWKDPNSSKKIILNNNSGTYKPCAKGLKKIGRIIAKALNIKTEVKIHRVY